MLLPRVQRALSFVLSSKLLRAAGAGVVAGWIQLAVNLIFSILFVRYLGDELYGSYQYWSAAVAVIPVFYSNLDQGIVRFFPIADRQQQAEIVFSAYVTKGIIFLIVAILAGSAWFFWVRDMPMWQEILNLPGMAAMALLMVLQIPLSLLTNTIAKTLQALQRFYLLTGLNLIRSILYLLWLILVVRYWKLDVIIGLPSIVGGQLFFNLLFLFVVAACVRKYWPGGWRLVFICLEDVRGSIREGFGAEVRRYVLPLQVTGLMGYLKQYLPGLAIGAAIGMAEVTYFRVTQQIFAIIHKMVPNALTSVFPGMVRIWEGERIGFGRRIKLLNVLYVGALTGVALLLLLETGRLFALWDLDASRQVYWLFLIFGIGLIAGAASQVEFQYLLLGKATRSIMLISPVRQLISSGLTIWLVQSMALTGAGLGDLMGMLWNFISISWSARKVAGRSEHDSRHAIGVAVVFMLLFIGVGIWIIGIQ